MSLHFATQIATSITTGFESPQSLFHALLEKVSLAFGKAYFFTLDQSIPPVLGPETLFFPLVSGEKFGTFAISPAKNVVFSDEDMRNLEWVAHLLTLLVVQIHNKEKSDRFAVKSIIGTLTYSELTATLSIFKQLEKSPHIILGKFADAHGFSRSIVGNAVRKIEASGAIETRSLGVKGTNIRIINEKLLEELHKLRV